MLRDVFTRLRVSSSRRKVVFAASMSLFGVTGCSTVDPSFSEMSASYQTIIEQYNYNNILLNIVRGSKQLPLAFLDIPSVVGTGSIQTNASGTLGFLNLSPGLMAGAAGTYGSVTPSVTVNKSFNFTQSSLDNAVFQTAFLAKIPLQTVNFFNSDQYPPELIFNLMVESIGLVKGSDVNMINNNPAYSKQYPQFLSLSDRLISYGLTTESVTTSTPVGPALSPSEVSIALPGIIPAIMAVPKDKVLQLQTVPAKNGKPSYTQLVELNNSARLCFVNGKLSSEVIKEFGSSYFCGNLVSTPEDRAKNLGISNSIQPDKNTTSLAIKMRSTRDIFQYLGLVYLQQTKYPQYGLIRLNPSERYYQGLDPVKPVPLLVLNKGEVTEPTLAKISYQGETYSIPLENNGYSPLVLNILSQLLNLNKGAGSIPASPAVLIK